MKTSAIVIAIGVVASWPAASSRTIDVVKVRTSPYTIMAPYFIGKAEGYFARQGIQVEDVEMATGSAIVPALIRGDIDVLPTAITPGLFNAIIRGGRIRAVASQLRFGNTCSHLGIVVTRALYDSGVLSDPARLRGRTYSLGANVATDYIFDAALRPLGLTTNDLKGIDVPDAASIEALRTGRLDLSLVAEPTLARSREAGQVEWKSAASVLPGFQYAVVLYGPNLLDAKPDVGRRFLIAYLQAVQQFVLGKTARNLDVLTKPLGMDRDLLSKICWPPANADGDMNSPSILAFESWLLDHGQIDRTLPLQEILDTRFLDAAHKALGK